MTEKYKILGKFIKDMSSETPDAETYIFVKDYISKYQLNIDINSKAVKNKMIEISTILKFEDKQENKKKSYFEINYATIVEIDDQITDGCWTNLKEVREYSEKKLRANRLKVVDFDAEYTLEIQGLGQKTLHCHAYVSIKIRSTGNNADGIASDALILLTRQSFIYSETKLNNKIIGFMQAFFNEFK